jgi:hypothetical protein
LPAENGVTEFNPERVRANIRNAATEDLLDRATVYRPGLEPAALTMVLEELKSRGVTPEAVVNHEEARRGVVFHPGGPARPCARCYKPAVVREWGWHRMFGKLPLFPRQFYLCADHRREPGPVPEAGEPGSRAPAEGCRSHADPAL